jgi:hypothetical protein
MSSMLIALVCPISSEKIDSHLSRITVFLNVVFMTLFLITLHPLYILLVAVDYYIRAFLKNDLSPLRFLAVPVRKLIKIQPKHIDLAPKLFAARLGFIFSFTALVLFLTDNVLLSVGVTSFLMVLSFLDSVFDFCLGCLTYTYFVFPLFKKQNKLG